VTCFSAGEAACATSRPISVDPVKAMRFTAGCRRISSPTVEAGPVTMLAMPGGTPASCSSEVSMMSVSGVVLAGLISTALPAMSAGATFQAYSETGKLKGRIAAHRPIGCLRVSTLITLSPSRTYLTSPAIFPAYPA